MANSAKARTKRQGRAPSAAQKKAAELANHKQSPYWGHLSDKQRALVEDPFQHAKLRGADYPLLVSQLATLVNVSEDQIRRWHDAGLIPAARSPGGHRRFYTAAAARAFFLKGLGQNGISVLRQVSNGQGGPLLVGISAVLADEAAKAEPEKQELLQRTAGDLEKVGASH
jgi:excisionase family DNA binding protein